MSVTFSLGCSTLKFHSKYVRNVSYDSRKASQQLKYTYFALSIMGEIEIGFENYNFKKKVLLRNVSHVCLSHHSSKTKYVRAMGFFTTGWKLSQLQFAIEIKVIEQKLWLPGCAKVENYQKLVMSVTRKMPIYIQVLS